MIPPPVSRSRFLLADRRHSLRTWVQAVAYLLAAFLALSSPAFAEEVIQSFKADIAIQLDGTVRVKETIEVKVEQKQIRRGIFRDLPVQFRDDRGDTLDASYSVSNVTRNGVPEPYVTERKGDFLRIRIGRSDVILDRSVQTYEITYETGRQVGFYKTYDELYWNVTGNGWAFPILRAEARVVPPEGARFDRFRSYTGLIGSTESDTNRRDNLDSSITVSTTRRLLPGEGLTVAGIWPKGIVTPPPAYTQIIDDIAALGSLPVLLGYGALLGFFTLQWVRKGRDPQPGPLVPRYYPPAGLGAASLRYVRTMGMDDKALTAAILSMAGKRYLIINEQAPNEYFLERTFRKNVTLTKGERAVADALYKDGPARFDVSRINHTRLRQAKKDLEKTLKSDYEVAYFTLNTSTVLTGAAIGLVLLLWLAISSAQTVPTVMLSVWLSLWGFGTYEAVVRSRTQWLKAARRMTFIDIFSALTGSVPLIMMTGGLIVGAIAFIAVASAGVAIIAALIVGTCVAFYHWMKAPTRVGRRLLDEIDGFRQYLKVAEQDRMNFHNPPEMTPELFEAYLPHALALDVEQDWSELFEEQLAQATQVESGGSAPYRPLWYYAGGTRPFAAGRFSNLLATQFSSSLVRASNPPQHSSGSAFSSSGGFSGVGGGGGGGGGW